LFPWKMGFYWSFYPKIGTKRKKAAYDAITGTHQRVPDFFGLGGG
jgi:hypothetical protein